MRNIIVLLACVATFIVAVSCGKKKDSQKVLVIYYSQTSNTKTVADEIANWLEADMEEIVPVKPYDGTYQETIERCLQEREQGIIPEIQPVKSELSKYDVIFIGYPIWFGTYAPPVAAFLESVDLTGKKVVPFCTFGSGGLTTSEKDLAAKQPGAELLPGYGVRAARMDAVPAEVETFLKRGGFIEGEVPELEAFSEPRPVTEEESAIFDAAVSTYPMMGGAKASTVASRHIPEGMEYLFTTIPQPRNDNPRMPPPGEMKVYVLAADGQEPVFTQVVR
ncbi:MAG: NAD(P)H-dependent oxidoreductase [Bacteroidales bacterium]|nr:NAD(P)H-dependent oxidoreductase [Bacteroidales bacterium]